MKKKLLVLISWEDPCSSSGWKKAEEHDLQSALCLSAGFLLKTSDKKNISLCQNMSNTGNVGEVITIPRKNVISIKSFKRKAEKWE